MKLLRHAMCLGLLATSGLALADPKNYCRWTGKGPVPMEFVRDLSTLHIAKDAPLGSVIGEITGGFTIVDGGTDLTLECYTDGNPLKPMRMSFVAAAPIFPDPLPPFEDGHVLKTNIDGIGARVKLSAPFDGTATNYYAPDLGNTVVPFDATLNHPIILSADINKLLFNDITLIKTGNIAPGQHTVNTLLFRGIHQFEGIGVLNYTLTANVIQAQCQIVGDPVAPNPVDLGSWELSDFTGPPFATRTEAFEIRLTSCQTDPGGLTQVSIELDPTNGSRPLDKDKGIISLSNDASNDAGIGIQVVDESGNGLPLNREVTLQPIGPGSNMALKFGAHFIQTHAKVRAGQAEGALNFTLRYR